MQLLRLRIVSNFLVFIGLMGCCWQLWAFTLINANKELRLAVIYNHEPPFFYLDEQKQITGILPQLAKELSLELAIDLVLVPTPRKGLEQALLADKADIAWLSKEWVVNANKMAFSESVFNHKDFLYSLKPFDQQGGPMDWLKNKSVCVREDYIYPLLFEFFAQGYGEPTFVSNQVPLLKMLEMGRCDLLFISEHRVNWMKEELNFTTTIWQSPKPLEQTGLTFMLNKKYQNLMPTINQAIAKIKQDGRLDKILRSFHPPAN